MHEPAEANMINLLIIKDQMHVHPRISGYIYNTSLYACSNMNEIHMSRCMPRIGNASCSVVNELS